MIVSIEKAIELLMAEEIVAVPTETVYGLAGLITSEQALHKIFATKQRPFFDPLIVHVANQEGAKKYAANWPLAIELLTRTFWPGPLTVVVKRTDAIHPLITSGLDTVGLRCPSHPIAQTILKQLSAPFAAPSANRFGRTSPTCAQHVEKEFSSQVPVVDGGDCELGIESTVIRFDELNQRIEILRPGTITAQQIQEHLQQHGLKTDVTRQASIASPGHLEHHYQPTKPLALFRYPRTREKELQALQGLGHAAASVTHFELPTDPRLAARTLYSQLHNLSDGPFAAGILWLKAEQSGPDWDAILDRLQRAATLVSL